MCIRDRSGGYEAFRSVAEKLNIPIVTYWNAVDLIEDENPLYCGRAGNMGDLSLIHI